MALWMKASNERKSLSIGVGGVTMSHLIGMGVYYVSSDRGRRPMSHPREAWQQLKIQRSLLKFCYLFVEWQDQL